MTYVLGTLSRLVLDADAGNHRVNHAVFNDTKFLSTPRTSDYAIHSALHSWNGYVVSMSNSCKDNTWYNNTTTPQMCRYTTP